MSPVLCGGSRTRGSMIRAGFVVLHLCGTSLVKADVVETSEGESATGMIREVRDGSLTIAPAGKQEAPRRFAMKDLVRVSIDPYVDRRQLAHLLINNDGAQVGRTLSARLKLRAGLHRIVLPYWHESGNAMLRLQFSGPKQSLRVVSNSMLLHLADGATETRSPGLDAEGFRLPEAATGTAPGLLYTMHTANAKAESATVKNFVHSRPVVASGKQTMDRIGPKPISDGSGLILSGFLQIAKDGEYTFLLTSDGGSQLFLGPTPRAFRAIDAHRERPPWTLQLVTGDLIEGRLKSWNDSAIQMEMLTVDKNIVLNVPKAFVRELRGFRAAEESGSSSQLTGPSNLDTVFARNDANKIQPVPGRVRGIDGDFLALRYEDQDRRIKLDRVSRVVLSADQPQPAPLAKYYHALSLFGKNRLPGFWNSLAENTVTFETLWGQTLTIAIDDISGMSVRNGRLVFLSDLKPESVEQVPFLDRVVPYRIDRSLSGGPLQLRDGPHERGLSVHARTVLNYDLNGRFQKLLGVVGFEHPSGDIGKADVRVLGDERPLFENRAFSGADAPKILAIDVSGIKRLSLEVDFGENQDVGDRVIWADIRVLRDDVQR